MLTSTLLLLLAAVISSCMGSPQETVKESVNLVGEEDAQLMRRTGLGHHGYGGGTSCLVKGSYCRWNSQSLFRKYFLLKKVIIDLLHSCHYCKCEHGSIHCHAGKRRKKKIWAVNYFKYCREGVQGCGQALLLWQVS